MIRGRGASNQDPSPYSAACCSPRRRQGRAFGHDRGGAGDRVGEVEVAHGGRERRRRRSGPAAGSRATAGVGRRDLVERGEVRVRRVERGAQCCSESNGSVWPSTSDSARRIAQSSRASPGGKLARLAHLHPALRVHIGAGLLGIGGARQDHVGAMRAAVAVRADDRRRRRRARRRFRRRRELKTTIERRRPRMAGAVETALARHEAEIEAADARGRGVQHGEAVPASLTRRGLRDLRGEREDGSAVGARQSALPDDDHAASWRSREPRRSRRRWRSRSACRRRRRDTCSRRSGRRVRRSRPIGKPPMRQRLRMRALSTGASWRGLEPTIRSASASSMPAMVGLKR